MKDWECVYTRAECHHQGTKCSECPLTDLICDEFTDCLDLSYEQGRADAERDFQNSDYWNDYLAKVIKDAKVDMIDECLEIIDKIMPSEPFLIKSKHYENWKVKTTELRMLRTMLEQLKEQKNEVD